MGMYVCMDSFDEKSRNFKGSLARAESGGGVIGADDRAVVVGYLGEEGGKTLRGKTRKHSCEDWW